MKLPHADMARVDREKITEYLLSPSHPDGRHKSRFFEGFGFGLGAWESLQQALREHAAHCPVVGVVESRYGLRYVVEGPLATPDGRDPRVRTVWVVEVGATIPRLVTAYPGK